jgi:hypothetical protein
MLNTQEVPASSRRAAATLLWVAFAAISVGCASVKVPVTPLQVSLVTNTQFFTQDSPVRGISLNLLAGRQEDVAGLDVGLLNAVDKELTGLQTGLVNMGKGSVRALQVGVGNSADVRLVGAQLGLVNQSEGELRGAQLGGANFAGQCSGVQLGLVNKVDSTRCLQIGVFNLNPKGFLPFFPIVLIGF